MKIFVTILFLVLVVTSFFTLFTPVSAENWQYPLARTLERPSYKSFGQYFDKNSYIGKETLFPTKFIGFHSGTDLEIFPEEANINVPVFAVSDGTISFIGSVDGYGGLIMILHGLRYASPVVSSPSASSARPLSCNS